MSSSARAASEGAAARSGTGRPGGTFSSLRTERMRDTSAITPLTSAEDSARAGRASKSGRSAAVMAVAAVAGAQRTYQEQQLRLIDAETRARRLGVEIAGLQLTGGLNPAEIGTAIQGGGGQRRAVQAAVEQSRNARLNTFAPAAID